ncbi:MAG: hypothetical protein B7Z55_05195 [Planctomycetales bacterium 12-60-4]|nr:MAG: hypothetical protein B7Z55_05195 [Planctomycetales bacterium 12-60-4]
MVETAVGWMGVCGTLHNGVLRTFVGYAAPGALVAAIEAIDPEPFEDDWCPELRERLCRYFDGRAENFQDVRIAAMWSTEFQRQVIAALRAVPRGETVSYQELASRAGRPNAARAVGQVMASNPVPILVPCHRVLASGGKIGGFSAPTGLDLKRKLLALEQAQGLNELS